MSKKPARKPATGEKPAQYAPKLAIPLPLDKLVEGLLQVDPSKLPSKRKEPVQKEAATFVILPKDSAPKSARQKTKKTGAKKKG